MDACKQGDLQYISGQKIWAFKPVSIFTVEGGQCNTDIMDFS